MINEINAAVEHLCSLLHPAVDASNFKAQVQSILHTRYTSIWFQEDADRGSALRVLLWHAHGGGEGQDQDLLQACLENSQQLQLADFFSSPFTLWVDPGCVAIRLGHGPGTYLPSSSSPPTFNSMAIKVIYCRTQQQMAVKLQPPILTVQPSTPALDANSGTWSSMSDHAPARYASTFNYTHARSTSSSSFASSYTGSRSTSAGSYMSSVDGSERCPSLVGTSTAAEDSDSELSVEDMIDSGCYKNFDIIDDEDDNEAELDRVGDDTITGNVEDMEDIGDVTICAEDNAPAAIVNYDGGNVGVLGGGIRLGGANIPSKTKQSATAKPFTLPTHFQSQQGQFAPALPPPNSFQGFEQSLGFPAPSQQYMMIDGYSIPMTKRVRSRGRRSRGRGAGRAARRQAAALQALTEAEQNLNSSMPTMEFQGAVVEGCEDERIMAIVRQRADKVAKDMVKRHLEQERRKAEAKLQQVQYHQQQHHQQQQQQQQQQQFTPRQPQYQSPHMFHQQTLQYCY